MADMEVGMGCWAREVLVPEGPLYRVTGTAVSISCNVTGYEGPAQQNFEWFLYRPEAPDTALGIVSTKDTQFSYAIFKSRVVAGEVQVQRLQGDAVVLKIARLQAQDAGIYECHTPSTDTRYLGSYSGKVELRVLPDALQVSAAPPGPRGRQAPTSPPRLMVHEGQELALGCLARTSTQQHTHLAVSFGRSVPEAPVGRATLQEVVGIRSDLAVEAGAPYAERLAAGELRLGKEGTDRYRMVVGGAQAGDAGTYHCTAAEWIQDPDGSWAQIAEKRAVLAHVDVQTLSSQLAVTVGPGERRIGPGEPLELLCNVSGALPPAGRHAAYSVGWEMAPAGAPGPGRLVAQLDTEGVGSLGPGYEGRHIAMEKVASRTYRLRLEAARPGDAGTYRCLAKAYVRGSGTRLREAASARSRPLPVHVREEGERGLGPGQGLRIVNPFSFCFHAPLPLHQLLACHSLTLRFSQYCGNTLSFLRRCLAAALTPCSLALHPLTPCPLFRRRGAGGCGVASRRHSVPGGDCLPAVQHLCAGWPPRTAAGRQLVGGATRGRRAQLCPCPAGGWRGPGWCGRAGSPAWRRPCQRRAGGAPKPSAETAQLGARG
uniref:Immunoglobulin superfamily member 8 n=1 Tax=Macaca fascicularis TaxID=9541 RepID=A0A7N9CTN7_MACFA